MFTFFWSACLPCIFCSASLNISIFAASLCALLKLLEIIINAFFVSSNAIRGSLKVSSVSAGYAFRTSSRIKNPAATIQCAKSNPQNRWKPQYRWVSKATEPAPRLASTKQHSQWHSSTKSEAQGFLSMSGSENTGLRRWKKMTWCKYRWGRVSRMGFLARQTL